jgi:Predicted metal-dependent enzyme of the double-stranded beta helix superfamily
MNTVVDDLVQLPLELPLADLVAELDEACVRPIAETPQRVCGALRRCAARAELRPEAAPRQADERRPGYRRHILHADPGGRYTVVVLEWDPGQFSPVHAHHTWCGYAVVGGWLREDLYEWDARSDCARRSHSEARIPGQAQFSFAGHEYIHSLGNPGSAKAYSLHCYAVDGARVGTHVNRLLQQAGDPV